jgi:predicted membrane channel-forming protein YqfA (hemolysin III family)
MKISRERCASSLDAYPGQINWDYDRAEIIADGVVHVIGLCLGLIGAVTIVVIAVWIERIEIAPILVYVSASWRCWRSRLPTTCGRSRPPSGFCAASTTPRFIY